MASGSDSALGPFSPHDPESYFGKCRRKRSTAGEAESKGQSSASCTVYCPARRSSTTQKGARRGRFVGESVNGGIVLWKVQKMQLPSTSRKALPQTLDAAVICRAAYAQP